MGVTNEQELPNAFERRRPACVIALVVLLTAACGDARPVRVSRPDVVLITVDTLRADRLSSYGYARATSPHIDSLAADSMLFTNAITPRSTTAPSLASTLTGLYPHKHGVVTNFVQVDESLWTLPEILKDAGYETAAFVSNYVLIEELSNFDQGFDVYDDFIVQREPNRAVYERNAEGTVDAALTWLESRSEKPFFLWLHLIDPHGPYRPPRSYEKKFGPGPPRPLREKDIPSYQRLDSTDAAFYLDRYDGEIAYTDAQIGRLLDALRARGRYDDALVIFLADHGEAFGEHGRWFEHGTYIYEACNRIPLLLKLPKKAVPSAWSNAKDAKSLSTSDRLVSVMDITPTVLDVLALEAPAETDGESLLRVLKEGRQGEPFIFVDTLGMPRRKQFVGLRSEDAKLILRLNPKRQHAVMKREFYRLAGDRLERHNLSPSNDPIEKEMADRLDGWIERVLNYELPFETTRWAPPDGDTFIENRKAGIENREAGLHVEELRALGYVE